MNSPEEGKSSSRNHIKNKSSHKDMYHEDLHHHKQINQENWRHQQNIKALSNSNHSFNMYSTGKNSIFKNIFPRLLHEKLNDLFNKFYVPTNMRLIVIFNQDLQIIQDQVIKYSFVDSE